jgi:sugar lactone lactonase YvrE
VLVAGQLPSGATPVAVPTLTVLAGRDLGPSVRPQPALSVWFGAFGSRITSIAEDRSGNTFVAFDAGLIVKISANGAACLIAGLPYGPGAPTPGPAVSSPLGRPEALAVDGRGSLYVADKTFDEVLKITPQGVLSVIAGTGTQGSPTPGPASASQIGDPVGVAVDSRGNAYVADRSNNRIEKITADGTLSIFAGNGGTDNPMPGVVATRSSFQGLGDLAVRGNTLYFVDVSSRQVGKINLTSRMLEIVAGSGGRYLQPGPALSSGFSVLTGVAVDRTGNVFIADSDSSQVAKVTPGGTLSIVAGNGDYGTATPGPATATSMQEPQDVALDLQGNLLIADANSLNGLIYKVTAASGDLSILAGVPQPQALPSGSARSALLQNVGGIAVDAQGNTFGTLPYQHVVFKITPAGVISVVAGTGSSGSPTPGVATASRLASPLGVAVDQAGNLFIADANSHVVEKVTPAGILSIVAGDGTYQGRTDAGPATAARLGAPTGVALDGAGNLYIADGVCQVEKVSPSGALTIVAGTGQWGKPTPGPATSSRMCPGSLAADGDGNLYIADNNNSVIAKVSGDGMLSIVAGNGQFGAAVPGPATSSPLASSYYDGIVVDASGNLYIANAYGGAQGSGEIDKVAPDGTLSIFAGTGSWGSPVAGPASSSPIDYPDSLALGASGNLEVVAGEHILMIDLASAPHGPNINALRSIPGGARVLWQVPATVVGPITRFVAIATDENGVELGRCTTGRTHRHCDIGGLDTPGQVNVTVSVEERQVPYAASGTMWFSSGPTPMTIG